MRPGCRIGQLVALIGKHAAYRRAFRPAEAGCADCNGRTAGVPMLSSHAKSSRPLPFTPAVPGTRRGRDDACSVLAAIRAGAGSHCRCGVVAHLGGRLPESANGLSNLGGLADHVAGSVGRAVAGSSTPVDGGVLPGASDRSVVVQSTLVTVKATAAPIDSSLESRPAPPADAGRHHRTHHHRQHDAKDPVSAGGTSAGPKCGRSEARRGRLGDGTLEQHSGGSDRRRAYDAGMGRPAPAGHRGPSRSHDCRRRGEQADRKSCSRCCGSTAGRTSGWTSGRRKRCTLGRRPQAAAGIPGAGGTAGAVRVLRRLDLVVGRRRQRAVPGRRHLPAKGRLENRAADRPRVDLQPVARRFRLADSRREDAVTPARPR